MQDKIKLLLKQIDLKEEYYSFFNEAKLNKIRGNSEKTDYVFYIDLDKPLPIEVYKEFVNDLNRAFPEIPTKLVKFKATNCKGSICEYFNYYIDLNLNNSPMLAFAKECNTELEDNNVVIEVSNKAEAMRLKKIEADFSKFLKDAGYDVKISYKINNEKSGKVLAEIKRDLELKIPVVSKPINKPTELKNEGFSKYKRKALINFEGNVIMGKVIKDEVQTIDSAYMIDTDITIEGKVFAIDTLETKKDLKIITIKITDGTDSIYGKVFLYNQNDYINLLDRVKKEKWYKFSGMLKDDQYSREATLSIIDINTSEKKDEEIIDDAKEKRVELHTHTFMSQMDGLIEPKQLLKQAQKWGHKAIAITDHDSIQAFPDLYFAVTDYNKNLKEGEEPFKVIYGTELLLIDDTINIVTRENDSDLIDNTYVVFDFETTGFNAGAGDSIIEIGAVKIKDGNIIERFNELINPGRKLPQKIVEITNITDDMLKDKPTEEEAIKKFITWFGDHSMVAHNAKFDVSFLEMAYNKYNLGTFNNTVIDTLELSRSLDNNFSRHSLSALVKRYDVAWDETAHHRADYDAEGTALVFSKMVNKLVSRNYEKVSDLNKLVSKDEIHKYGRGYHFNILVKNKTGLKNLFKIVSLANTKYFYKSARILRSELEKLREGLLIGSSCYESEVFIEARSKIYDELANIISFYDYVEVQPLECYDHLLQTRDFSGQAELMEHVKKIIRVTTETGKIVVATGDVHHLTREDKIYREIFVNQKVPGGGRHPLSKSNITTIPSNHLRTTTEMLSDFSFLGNDLANEIVIKNPNIIADMIDIVEVIIETGGVPFSPKIENSAEIVKELVYNKAHEIYGKQLPNIIEERITQELNGIIKGGFDVIYLISQKLVKKSNDDGYIVGSRGSVGSSFVATLLGVTEVNPLPAHYVCPKCQTTIFDKDGVALGSVYSSGFDLPDTNCPNCKTKMNKDGQDMPFATFLGFDADKVPDIDLNFSGEYQWKAHEYTKELFGIDNVYRAGTIGTVATKTAFGFVKGYCEDKGVTKRNAEIERLAMGCTGVKRTTGQHPGGIVVIPDYMDVYDFTPYQYPANEVNSLWRTTHFDYHAIDQNVLKLDILGHDDPTMLRMLQDLSGMDVTKIPLDDKETMGIFTSPEPLGVNKSQILCETGTLGVPEFGTKFVIGMLLDTKPKSFAELVKISGLSHGTDVWLGNAQNLIKNDVVEFKDVIGCRDDIMVYLMYHGLEPKKSFKIMEFVRKGKASKDPKTWQGFKQDMIDGGIANWFIDSCEKIKYMFPKAHAAAYVISAYRIAYFKVHHPIWYYCSHFSIRCHDFDIETMIKGYDAIKNKIIELNNKGFDITNKETSILEVMEVALEATARGITFGNVDLNKSDAVNFIIEENTLIPPFRTIDGLGDTVAQNIVNEREKGDFLSIEDLQKRGKISTTLIDKMRLMGMLDGMDESSQLSLFNI